MTALAVLDLLRVLFAFVLVFLALPLLAQGYKVWRGEPFDRPPADWIPVVLKGFALASFAAEIMGLVLGSIRLCLPGIIVGACLVWSARGFLVAQQIRAGLKEEYAQSIWRPLIALLEPQQSSELRNQLRTFRFRSAHFSDSATFLAALLTLILFAYARAPIQHVSFSNPENYLRTISLATLTEGKPWSPDGSVAFLAPLVCFSGLDAASVIRFAGPVLSAMLAALLAICIWQIWRTSFAAMFTLGLLLCLAFEASYMQPELLPGVTASVYTIAAVALWPYSFRYALLAAGTGLMIAPGEWIPIAIGCLAFAGVYLSLQFRKHLKFSGQPLAIVVSLVFVASVLMLWHRANPDPQLSQYESAARTCKKITRDFHRNEWLIVSPFQELALTYGHGWHTELSEFVTKFRQADVSKASFSFPYEMPDVFFFVERRPLRLGSRNGTYEPVWRYAPAEASEWSTFLNGDPNGRASLEYQAAEMLNTYLSTHKNLSLFYQDDNLSVYHLATTHAGG